MVTPNNKKYFLAVGRRKTAVARVWLSLQKGGNIVVNGKDYEQYFSSSPINKKIAHQALDAVRMEGGAAITAKINGGGARAQAEALRHSISRALLKVDPEHRKTLKRLGYLKRDPRMKERRKFGLKKARKAPQWAKR